MVYPSLDRNDSRSSDMTDKTPSTPTTPVVSEEQRTVSTIISFSPDLSIEKKENESAQVESLSGGKSMESIKSAAISDLEGPALADEETTYQISVQVCIPFLIAGIGTIGAGIVLGNVENSEVFEDVRALYILVPAILGLKGNLDMCLASRLSTQSNLGKLKSRSENFKMVSGNIGLVQVQAIVAACCVAIFAVSVNAAMEGTFNWNNSLLLVTSSILTATLSCLTLDFILVGMVFLTQKLKLNPDNLATPLAASIGDVVSLIVLSTFASLLYSVHDSYNWIMYTILAGYMFVLLPMWITIVRKNEYTKKILTDGWTPVLTALLISGLGGLVLDTAVEDYAGFVVFQPIINGIGGNLVSVQCSRISTMLHKTSLPGIIPPHTQQFVPPWKALFKGVISAKTARILLVMSVPGQTIFVLLADLIYNDGTLTAKAPFVLTYLGVGVIQLMMLLYIAHILIHTMWKYKIDPDNSAIPYMTALGDLMGTSLLLLGFIFLKYMNNEYSPIQNLSTLHPT